MSKNRKHRGGQNRHNIRQQMEHAMMECSRHGRGKRADKKGGIETYDGIYGDVSYDTLKDTVTSFSNFLKRKYPDIKKVSDIATDMAQEYLMENQENWSVRTMENRMTGLRKLNHVINLTFKTADQDFTMGLVKPEKEGVKEDKSEKGKADSQAIRVHCVGSEDLQKLRNDLKCNKSRSRYGVELGARFGLRACEVVGLKAEEIDLEAGVIHIGSYAKNGKHRDVPIRHQDREWIEAVKREVGSGRIVPIEKDSYIKFLRDHFRKCGIEDKYKNEKQHALRKYYASERMRELRGLEAFPLTDQRERDAWNIVKEELGHGNAKREKLYQIYVKDLVEGA